MSYTSHLGMIYGLYQHIPGFINLLIFYCLCTFCFREAKNHLYRQNLRWGMWCSSASTWHKKTITLLQVILTVANCFVIVSDISSGSIYGIYFLTFYSSILSETFYSGILSGIYSDMSDILSGILSGISSEIFAGILSDILFGIYSGFLASSLAFYLAFYSGIYSGMHSGSLSGILFDILFWHLFWHSLWHGHWDLALAVEVWQCPLRSGARGWGQRGGESNPDKI